MALVLFANISGMKPLAALVAVTLGFISTAGCSQPEPRNAAAARTGNIVCFGDSVTAGFAVKESEAFPALLQAMWGRQVIVSGVPGDTTADALARLDSDVIARSPGLVIIELGGNDFLKQVPLEQTKANMASIIERVQGAGAMAAVVDPGSALLMRGYSSAFGEIAQARRALFLKHLLGKVLTQSSLKADEVHPNAQGHQALAQDLNRKLKGYVQ